jgi:hypothetical protein
MDNPDNREEVERLQQQLSEAKAKRAALLEEIIHLAAKLPETRRKFGNPFYYSHPEEPDEGIANYAGNTSHEAAGMSTLRELRRVERELARITDELRWLGVFAE